MWESFMGTKRDGEMVGQRDKEQKGGQAGTQHALCTEITLPAKPYGRGYEDQMLQQTPGCGKSARSALLTS